MNHGVLSSRALAIFEASEHRFHAETDQRFCRLLLFEWIASIAVAVWIAPLTWEGSTAALHPHIPLALMLGGLLSVPPWLMARYRPGEAVTRHMIAISQVCFSSLFVHLTGGRIETHFHIFGSLAFLSFYRDAKILISASVVVALDHLLRGIYYPQSVFGVLLASEWRWLEHTGWVIFEDIFLILNIQRGCREMRDLAARQVELQELAEQLEDQVEVRTSELQDALQEAQSANLAKSRFLANVTHELRTPITAVIGFAHILDELHEQDHRAREAIDCIQDSGQLLLSLVKDVLQLAALEGAPRTYEQRVFSPSKLLVSTGRVAKLGQHNPQVELLSEPSSAVPELVNGAEDAVRQVLLNLVSNALKFTEQGSVRLSVDWDYASGQLRFGIEDTGPGVPEDRVDRIFEPFTMGDESASRKKGGTGLGLAIAKRICEDLGGSLELKHNSSEGCRFEFSAPATVAKKVEEAQSKIDLSGVRLLVVEDNRVNQLLVRRLLDRMGCTVVIAGDGVQAIQAVADGEPFDAVLMDCQMPVMDGLEACRQLRAKGYEKPIIALTANDSQEDRDACRVAGMDGFLSKPIKPERLFQVLSEALNRIADAPA